MGYSHQFMFTLDDRSDMGTDVLLNRFAMKTMNVMVDPKEFHNNNKARRLNYDTT